MKKSYFIDNNYVEFHAIYSSIAILAFFLLELSLFSLGPARYSSLSHWENENEVLSALFCCLGERSVARTV